MQLSEKTFHVLDALDHQEILTQRQLAEHSGVSLSQVNYILKSLLKKGLVKIRKFHKNPQKIRYVYLLTPKGIETKSRLAVEFIIGKLREFNHLRLRLAERLNSIEKQGHANLIFVGPPIVKEFIDSIIKERSLKVAMVAQCKNWKDLENIDSDAFDIALLCDENSEDLVKIEEFTGISHKKLLPLW